MLSLRKKSNCYKSDEFNVDSENYLDSLDLVAVDDGGNASGDDLMARLGDATLLRR